MNYPKICIHVINTENVCREELNHCLSFYVTCFCCHLVSSSRSLCLDRLIPPQMRAFFFRGANLFPMCPERGYGWSSPASRCAIDDAQHHMSFRTSLCSWDSFLAHDSSIRVCDDTLLDLRIQIIDSVGGPAVESLGTLDIKRLCEFALASCKSGSNIPLLQIC